MTQEHVSHRNTGLRTDGMAKSHGRSAKADILTRESMSPMINRKKMGGSLLIRLGDTAVIRFFNKSNPKNARKPQSEVR